MNKAERQRLAEVLELFHKDNDETIKRILFYVETASVADFRKLFEKSK